MFGSKIQCPGSVYTGHKVGGTAQIPSGSTAATITPHYKQANCRTLSPAERRGTVAMNGCDYVFRLGGTVSANTYAVTADIVCPNPTEGIHVSVYELGDPTHTGIKLCTVEIAAQTGLTGAHVSTNAAADLLNVVGAFHGIHAERTGPCKLDGKGETTSSAEWDVDLTVTGLNSVGAPTGITVTD